MTNNSIEYKAVGLRYTKSESITFQGKNNLFEYKKMGYKITNWGRGNGNWIAFKRTKVELESDDGNWIDVTDLVRDYYLREKITKTLVDKFATDLASKNVDYEKLLKSEGALDKKKEDDYKKRIAADKAREKARYYDSAKKSLEKLVEKIESVLPQVSVDTKNELSQLIVQIKGSEVTTENYSNFYRQAVSLIVKERESRK